MKKRLCKMGMFFLVFLIVFNVNIPFLINNLPAQFENKAYAAQSDRRADIVFVIDTTGSMGGVINNVKNNISQFVDILNGQNINARLGLVTFKDIYDDGYYSTSNFGWFANINDFKNTLGGLSASGGGDAPESAVDGLEEARRMSYQPLSKKFIILVTDINYKEGTHFDTSSDRITMSREISLLQNDNIVVSAVVPSYYQSTYSNLYSSTGGIFTDISTAFSSNLNALTNMINTNSAPSLSILEPSPNQQAGTELMPKISVSDPDGDTLVSSYYLDGETTPRDSKIISNTTTAQQVTFNALGVNALSGGSHTLKIQVTDNWADPIIQTIQFSVDKTPPVIGNILTASTDSSINVTGTATDSGAGLSATPYRYTIGSNTSPWVSNSYTFNNLTPNTSYNVTVEARDELGNIASKQQQIYTKAQSPTATVIQSTESNLGIKLNDNNPAITQYQIKVGSLYLNASGSLITTPTWVTPVNKQITANGLLANTTYNIQAMAINQEGVATNWSGAITGTTLAKPPTSITSSRTQTSITVNWAAISGASSYDIEVDGSVIHNGTATSFTHSGLSPETRHSYRIRVVNAGGIGNWSLSQAIFSLPNPPITPVNITTASTQTEVTVTWDGVVKADSYDVEADGIVIDNGNNTTYAHRGLLPLTDHTYRIRAKNIGGISDWSQATWKKTLPYPPPTPGGITVEPSIHQVTVSWSKSEGADVYEIEADGLIIDNGDKTTYLHDGLDALSGHTYRIRAKNVGGKSAWSDPIDITTHPEIPDIPTNIMATAEESSITATWYKVPHAASYEVEIDGISVINVTNNQFVHSELTPDSRHTYRIRAENISGHSEWSAPVTLSTFPSGSDTNVSLTNVAAVVTNRFITISWDTVAPEARYDIEVDGVLMENGDNTIYHHTGLKANEFHTYKIRLKNEDHPSDWVAILSLSTLPDPPDAPTGIEAFATNNSIEIRWQKNTGATGYDIEIDGKTMDAGTNSAYTHKELTSGTAHTYRVRAKNVTGVTAWSAGIVKSTTSPTYTVNGVKDKNFDLSLLASNVQDFSELTYVVTYDPNQLEAVDLFGFTPKTDLPATGKIPGSNLDVTYTAGRVTFKINQNVVPGTSWSGEITTIVFKSKIDGQAMMDVVVE